MNRPAAIAILSATIGVSGGCAHAQPEPVVDSLTLPIRDCVRARMSAAGFKVTDEGNVRIGGLGPGRALVGESSPGSGSLNRAGPVDYLTVWYTDSSFTPLGWTSGGTGGMQLLKSTRLRDLEDKLARECRGYSPIEKDAR